MKPLRVLTFTSLFPSAVRPRHGIFVETRLRQILAQGECEARVIAPVPWFPWRSSRFGAYAVFAATPRVERRGPVDVSYPRYLMLPKVGVAFQPQSMTFAAWRDVCALAHAGWRPDVIDAHYLYPDGVAAAALARRLRVPYVLTARGTDVNVLARDPMAGPRILKAVREAAAVVVVSPALRDVLIDLGADKDSIHVLRNGVDRTVFHPAGRNEAKAALGFDERPLVLNVGNMLPEKGQALALQAVARLSEWQLAIVGDGPLATELSAQAAELGLDKRVRFVPVQAQDRLRQFYSAADVLVSSSQREGWPNVVLEAMACGTPVVATDVGAVREMITHDWCGSVVPQPDAVSLAQALQAVYERRPDPMALVAHARTYDWDSVARQHLALLAGAARGAGPAPAAGATPQPARQQEAP